MLNWAEEYHNLVSNKLPPGTQGGVISREGEVLFTTNPDITSAVADKGKLADMIDKGLPIFVTINILGQDFNVNGGKGFRDDIAKLTPVDGDLGGGLIAVPRGLVLVAFNPTVSPFELDEMWTEVMQDAVRILKERIPE